jgi:hypothetical protein
MGGLRGGIRVIVAPAAIAKMPPSYYIGAVRDLAWLAVSPLGTRSFQRGFLKNSQNPD